MSKTSLSHYFSYAIDTKVDPAAVTNYGGLFPYLDLLLLTDLPGIVTRALPPAPAQGWQPAEHVTALLALNLTGGDCVDDLAKLADDPGIAVFMGQIRRALGLSKRRMPRGGTGVLPSLTSVREWLVTDGLGGYACGTVAGLRTRRYHGLLMVPTATAAS